MTTLLITGGAGFIGSCLVRQLVADENLTVVNLDKLTYAGNLDSLDSIKDNPRHIFVQGDIGDRALVTELLDKYQPQAVVNLAAAANDLFYGRARPDVDVLSAQYGF